MTPSMTNYEFGDGVLVPFPFTDQTTSKKRPAVVVSSSVYHEERPDLIIMAITSQLKASPTVERYSRVERGWSFEAFGYETGSHDY